MTTTHGARAREAGEASDDGAGASRPADDPPSSRSQASASHARPGARVVVDVRDETGLDRAALAWFGEHLDAAVRELGVSGEARIAIVNDGRMAREHVRTMGVEGTTDVLTFDLTEGASAGGDPLDADVLLCADEARRRAGERGHALERELLLYALHGVLHCLGYDDTDEASFGAMHAREDEVLEAIGVGATFKGGEGAS